MAGTGASGKEDWGGREDLLLGGRFRWLACGPYTESSPDTSALEHGADLVAEVTGRGEFGERTLRFDPVTDFFAIVEKLGHVPLPPYIAREDRPEDRERYQTVYARAEATGSVAAPTAGLHFTPAGLADIRAGASKSPS